MAPPARALRAALKEAAGKLLAQLYDRNSRRQFVPLEAFQTDSLPPERFQVEMQTAAAASGGLMQAINTRVWGLLRYNTTSWGHMTEGPNDEMNRMEFLLLNTQGEGLGLNT